MIFRKPENSGAQIEIQEQGIEGGSGLPRRPPVQESIDEPPDVLEDQPDPNPGPPRQDEAIEVVPLG